MMHAVYGTRALLASGPPSGLLIQSRAQLGQDRIGRWVLLPVCQVERIVEVGRVFTLGVLQDRLQLVESFGPPCLRGGGRLVLVPETLDLGSKLRRKWRDQGE